MSRTSRTGDVSLDGGGESSRISVENKHSSRRKGNHHHVIHERTVHQESISRASSSRPHSRHHTIIITDPEAAARKAERKAAREAQQLRRYERELRREQRREREERRETRKAHSRDLDKVIAALRSQSKRSPISPSPRSANFDDEVERLRFALAESERDSESLRNKLRELTDRLDLESKRATVAENQYKDYNQRLRNAEVARKKAEADASREAEESSRLKVIYETARAQAERVQQELDALEEERADAEKAAADARTAARKLHEQLLVNQAREAGRKEGRREGRRMRNERRREKTVKQVEPVEPETPPQAVHETEVHDDQVDSRRTTPRVPSPPELPPIQRDPTPQPPPPPPVIPESVTHSESVSDHFPDLPDPPTDIHLPEVMDPAPLPPAQSSSGWWKNKLGKIKRSNSRTESFSADSYLDEPSYLQPSYQPPPPRSTYTTGEYRIPSRTAYRDEYEPEPERSPSPSPSPEHEEYRAPPPPAVPTTGMAGIGSMSGIGPMGSMAGMGSMSRMGSMTGLTTIVPGPGAGPGAGPGVGPGAGPSAGPSTLVQPPQGPPPESKSSRKHRRPKVNVPPPQPVFPPPETESPIHPIPYNNGLASPWHHKPTPILPEGWIPDATGPDGRITLPPAHEIHPSPLLVNTDLEFGRSQHPVVPNAPFSAAPKTPKHRAGSQPTTPYTPLSFSPDVPVALDPPFDPLVPRTPAHYGRPLSVIPEASQSGSPERQPIVAEAPLPRSRHSGSSRPKYSQAHTRQDSDDRSASISVESFGGTGDVVSEARKPSRWRKWFSSN